MKGIRWNTLLIGGTMVATTVKNMTNTHVDNQVINVVQDEKPLWKRFVDGLAWGAGSAAGGYTAYKVASIGYGMIRGGAVGAQTGASLGPVGLVAGTTLGAATGGVFGAAGVLV